MEIIIQIIGQVVLEVLDLVVDSRTSKLMSNPASPETPMIDIFIATSPNNGHTTARDGPVFMLLGHVMMLVVM